MKKVFAIMFLVFAVSVINAEVFPSKLAGATFNKPLSVTKADLSKEHINLKDDTVEGFIAYDYEVGGDTWQVMILEEEGMVIRIVISKPAKNIYSDYISVKNILSEKYGKPKNDIAQFSYPYEAGDGFTDTAIEVGKARIVATWEGDNWQIMELPSETGTVSLIYTSDYAKAEKINKESENKRNAQF